MCYFALQVVLALEVCVAASSSSNSPLKTTTKKTPSQIMNHDAASETSPHHAEAVEHHGDASGIMSKGRRRRPHSPSLREFVSDSSVVGVDSNGTEASNDTSSSSNIINPSALLINEEVMPDSISMMLNQSMMANMTKNMTEDTSMISIIEELLRWQIAPIVTTKDPSIVQPKTFAATSNMLCSVGWEDDLSSNEFTKRKVLRCRPVQLANIAFDPSECDADTGVCSRVLDQN